MEEIVCKFYFGNCNNSINSKMKKWDFNEKFATGTQKMHHKASLFLIFHVPFWSQQKYFLFLFFHKKSFYKIKCTKIGCYTILYRFFSCITYEYQIFIFNWLYTRTFYFRHFSDFHILFVYKNRYISTTYQKFDINQFYTKLRKLLFSFLLWSDNFLLIPQMIWSLLLNQCAWMYTNFSCKRCLIIIYIYMLINTQYIYLKNSVGCMCLEV